MILQLSNSQTLPRYGTEDDSSYTHINCDRPEEAHVVGAAALLNIGHMGLSQYEPRFITPRRLSRFYEIRISATQHRTGV